MTFRPDAAHAAATPLSPPDESRRRFLLGSGLALGAAALGGRAFSAPTEHRVEMLNRGPDGEMMAFAPAFLKVAPGDTVTFVPTDKSHNAESILGMIPEGAEAWKGKINQEISVTFETEGVYGYKCLPHYPLGMVGLIQVGEAAPNLAQAQEIKHPGRAAQRMALLIGEVQTA
jgi:pseudoazurin